MTTSTHSQLSGPFLTLTLCAILCLAPAGATAENLGLDMPWREAGLTERQAAAHLLDRFTYGARPGEVDRVVSTGLETWFAQQLDGTDEPNELRRLLRERPTLDLDAVDLARTYPAPGMVLALAVQEGVVERPGSHPAMADDAAGIEAKSGLDDKGEGQDSDLRRAVEDFAEQRGFKPQREAMADLMIQKLARARYSENQLHEVLTDFWFNHFNVSLTDNQARIYLWPYERDAIRPHVLGSFRDMLGATAKHPAMLLYLDNALSVADGDVTTTLDLRLREAFGRRGALGRPGRQGLPGRQDRPGRQNRMSRQDRMEKQDRRRASGLNENYARELMELHTLGVDGGYSQDDVVAVARAFTGWSIVPPRGLPERLEEASDRRRQRAGFVIDGPFLFRADAHDAEAKVVLGTKLRAGRGIEDGEDVLDLLANHPSTARHLSTKLATRFVSDQPPEPLVDRLAATYLDSESGPGDLRSLLVSLVNSPEFWSEDAVGQKIKSPFELAMSALRALDARPRDPRELVDWIRRMGQPLYGYQAPTGYPDRAEAWVNAGALLERMNFGLQVAAGRVTGLRPDLDRFTHALPDDASPEARLRHWLALLLPERDPEPTVRRLLPVVEGTSDGSYTAQVVGVILGSPEFQRR